MARIELFLVWESNCRSILEDLQNLPEKILDDIKVRIFLRKDTPSKNRPPNANWIELYHSFTTSPFACDTTLTAFLIKHFKDLALFSDEAEQETTNSSSCDPVEFYFVVDSETERKFEELIAILDIECKSKIKMKTINGQEEDIPNVLGYYLCKDCKVVFDSEDQLNEHDTEVHNFFCDNPNCQRSKTRFYNAQQLSAHKAKQTTCLVCQTGSPTFCEQETKFLHMQAVHGHVDDAVQKRTLNYSICDFCPTKLFSSPEQHESHVQSTHKKCNCGCAIYFETRRHYLEHFYDVYPLACFENRKCPYRFQTVFQQAEHHKNVHNSQHAYYCATCSTGEQQSMTGRVNKTCAFKDEKNLRHHGALMKHTLEEMFLIEGSSSSKPTAKSSAINYC